MGPLTRLLHPKNDIRSSEELAAFLRGSNFKTWSGVEVSVTEAMKDPAWFGAGRNIAEDIAKLPFVLYEAGEARDRATSHQYWKLVHDKVTSRWTSQQFREYMTFWAEQDGDAFALKNVIGGVVREMVPFKRGQCEKDLDDRGDFFYWAVLNGERRRLTRREVFHLEGFALRVEGGAELFKMSREDIGLSLATERHGATYFGNGAHPSLGLSIPGELSDDAYERLQTSIREEFTGANAHSGPLLLEGGAKAENLGGDNESSQYLETRTFQVQQHGRRLRVPPHKIGDLSHAHYNNVEQDNTNYVVDSLLPWAIRWENAYNQQVIGTDRVYAELLFEMLLRGDAKTRSEFYASAIQNGYMTENEARRRENLPPLPGGDVLYTQTNLASPQERKYRELKLQTESLGNFVRAGFDPEDALRVCGIDPIKHTGRLPITVQAAATDEEKELASV